MPASRPTTISERPRTRGRPRTGGSIVGNASQQIICALTEARGVIAQVGLAFINVSTAECILSEICDSQTYVRTLHKLAVFDPIEILIPDVLVQARNSKLPGTIEENLPGARVTPLPRKYYNEKIGTDYIARLSFKSEAEAVQVALSGKFYAVSAAAAAIKHIELQYNIGFIPNSLRVKYQSSEGAMVIDLSTVRNLELAQNLQNPKSADCLYGLLNNTVTPMGARLLRSSIMQPLTEAPILDDRLDAVEELAQNMEMYSETRKALSAFSDMDKLLTSLVTVPANSSIKFSEKSINDVILLKKELASIVPIQEALAGCQSKLLQAVRSLCNFEKVQHVQDLINESISEDAVWAKTPVDLRHQRCYAVKSGVNGLLDVARQTYKEATEDLHVLFQELARDHNLPSLEIKYDVQRGYYLRIPTADLEDNSLPAKFVNLVRKKKFTECTTLDMMKRNARIGDAMTEVLLMSDKTIQELIDDIRGEMAALYKVCEGIAMLDMIASFTHLCIQYNYVRPEFKDALAIKEGRHPIREKIHKEKLIPNDVYASRQSRFQIVTGCNMSGKSTYIRQIALMTIMAQVGSFVPATYASFPITTHLFARVSMDDGIEANVSTFAAEMRETAFILQNATDGCMVIMDELGRGTCTRDGLAIAIAVCEALMKKRAFVWFATHFRELATVLGRRAGCIALHMQVEMREEENITSMLYKIADGPALEKHYGINLARIIGLPGVIVDRATEVSTLIIENANKKKAASKGSIKAQRRKVILQLHEHLDQARKSQMTDGALRKWLSKLQRDFIQTMSELRLPEGEEEDEIEDEIDETTTTVTSTGNGADKLPDSFNLEELGSYISREGTPIIISSQRSSPVPQSFQQWAPTTQWNGHYNKAVTSNMAPNSDFDNQNVYSHPGTYSQSVTIDGLEDIEELSDVEDQI